ncbi:MULTISPECIES: AraC family transcriptional regulator [Marivita]|uniref:AraC family transcriptional regulator ligand-binding domain-containing protein n=1 Tax=Marivita cryptomonadis TaxID=505252 RepID=A0A9Q2P747_9RHOB|nr:MULTISPECIES: AraC family transcriptional regulator [Marivita]MCR9168816.1 AraC family transcriptional regulator [Paracoccaceae bacterium]MBM2323472.1 AraC family transcriptional regulator ligand-binding domain-containing protein [Marivita cryptomonadis]MBM2333058.1 AraC family transcriptional regulator ligand-binding domain-containing protein [Marivita cryptomonadis]MBM2342638.1 AraC family transcriptional regulator ligand-binding domain-containing protein [Marivita cryptomonadis]MBM234730
MQRSSQKPTVHVGKVWRLMLADLGLSATAVLRRAGLPSGLLDGDGNRITLDEFYALWESFDAEAQSPTLALKLGQIEASEFFDPAFFAAMCAPNMTVAGQRLGEFKRLVGAFSLDVEVMPAATRFTYRCKSRPDLPATLAATEIVFLVNLLRRATRRRVVPQAVVLPSALQETSAFEDWFGCGVTYGDTASFSLDPIDAMRPFLTHDTQMWQSFEPDLRRRMDAAREDLGMRTRVENALLELLPSGRTQIDDVAGELAVSRRSLQRRLSEEGTSWLDVLNAARMRLAQHYLTNTKLGAAEVSFLLGFEDPNSFFRAFRRWTGSTPEAWREAHRQSA